MVQSKKNPSTFDCRRVFFVFFNDVEPDGDAQGDDAGDDEQPCGGVQDDDPARWQNWSIRGTAR
jgi:hypothetical protein